MLVQCLYVAVGGAAGAVSRFLMGMVPFAPKTEFPMVTLLINLVGAFFIGMIAQTASMRGVQNDGLILCLKVGVCGGFTTFSTFSLEAVTLFSNGKTVLGMLYIVLSIFLCLCGVMFGQWVAARMG